MTAPDPALEAARELRVRCPECGTFKREGTVPPRYDPDNDWSAGPDIGGLNTRRMKCSVCAYGASIVDAAARALTRYRRDALIEAAEIVRKIDSPNAPDARLVFIADRLRALAGGEPGERA